MKQIDTFSTGAAPNDGTGAPLRDAGMIIGANFSSISEASIRGASAATVPNLFEVGEVTAKTMTHYYSGSTLPAVASTYGPTPCWAATTPTDSASNSTLRWEFPAAAFADTKLIAASLRIFSISSVNVASSPVLLSIIQYNSSHGFIAQTDVSICSAEGVTTPATYLSKGVVLDDACVYVQMQISLSRLGGARLIQFGNLHISAGIPEFSMPPVPIPNVSIFPDPFLQGVATTTAGWAVGSESGEHIMSASGLGTIQEIWTMPIGPNFGPGDKIAWSAELYTDIASGCDLTLIQYNGSGTELSRLQVNNTVVNAWAPVTTSLLIASTCARVDMRLVRRGGATVGKIRRPVITSTSASLVVNAAAPAGSSSGRTVLQVDATGSDANDGVTAPVKTFTRAMALAGPDTLLLVAAGDYTDAPTVSGLNTLEVRAKANSTVRLIGGTKVTGATATSGTTKTYQFTLATAPTSNYLCLHDVPEVGTLISAADRLAIHAGRAYRLPFTRIFPVATLEAIDAASLPSWYWESGVLYFSVPDGSGPNDGVYIPSATLSPFSGGTGGQIVKASGIQSLYWKVGFNAGNCAHVTFDGCRAYGAAVDGFSPDNTHYVAMTCCEAGGNSNDGAGGHRTLNLTDLSPCQYVGHDNWFHDNWDDGQSFHEYWRATDFGGVSEYNGDRGVVPANGCHQVCYGMRSRANGQNPTAPTFDGGEGFLAAGVSGDTGIGTQIELYGCISERNPINFSATGADNNLRGHVCHSVDPTATHFLVSTPATMYLDRCTYSGAGTVKSGAPTITNGNAVT